LRRIKISERKFIARRRAQKPNKKAKFADFKEIFYHRGLVLDGQALASGVGDAGRDAGG